ncbi:delta8-fatty-acid desaturase [Vigna unguiculata]|uniref:Delta8-fatty-acid desaturase n=1 Tax=Vigna unguiculata TaxID=3917 RepID=A0A4D6LDT2_VIGUN|nr:delta8-fatty-acid desaturase [Vigna unguiculata]
MQEEEVDLVRRRPPPYILHSTFVHLLSDAMISFLWIQSCWIGHNSGHYNVMLNRHLNRAAQILSANILAGISNAWWKWNHNSHHPRATTSTSTQIFNI